MFYKIVKFIGTIWAYILFRFDVTGQENIPKEGAFLLCGNHISVLDPIAVAVFSKRQPRFISKAELFMFKPFGAVLRALGAFPVNRNATDMQAYRHAMGILKNGHGMLIFAQGTRMKEFENAKSGVAVFALKSGAPVIPVGIVGPYRFRSKIRIKFGQPISMEEYQGQKVRTELVDEVMEKITEQVTMLTK